MLKSIIMTAMLASTLLFKNCHSPSTQPAVENRPRPAWLTNELHAVFMIEAENTVERHGSYLIDLPIAFDKHTLPAFFINQPIPLDLFTNTTSFYPTLEAFILVIPDWEFYQKIAEYAEKSGITIEPTVANHYYYISRADGQLHVDDYYIVGEGHPALHYQTPVIPKANIVVYRKEEYGSVCCPRDEMYALAEQDAPFIKAYEQQQHIKITGTFRQNYGKEGEHCYYYTLSGLTAEERLAFLLAKNEQWQWQGKGVFNPSEKQIITPMLVPLVSNGPRNMQPVTYE